MYSVLNKLSEYIYFYISKHITPYTSLLVFKIVESFHYILITKKKDRESGGYWLKKVTLSVINKCTIYYVTFVFGS